MASRVKLDRAGLIAVLKSSEVANVVEGMAERVADNIDGTQAHDGPVEVGVMPSERGDRAGALVTIMHPAGIGLEAKHGVMTRAASAAGLRVTARKAKA